MPEAPPRWAPVVLLLLSLLVYLPTLANGFTYDADDYVRVHNAGRPPLYLVEEIRPLGAYFRHTMACKEVGGQIEEQGRGFRPLTVFSYALVHQLSRRADSRTPGGFHSVAWLQHLTNLLLHLGCSFLVWRLLLALRIPDWPALIGTAVFALQPMHADPVVSMVGRGELLPFACATGACLAYLRGLARQGRQRLPWLGLAGLGLFAACLSKESAVAWLVFCPLLGICQRLLQGVGPGVALRQQGLLWLAPLAAGLGYTLLYLNFLAGLPQGFALQVGYEFNPLYRLPAIERWPAAVTIWLYGLAKLFFATGFAADYGLAVFQAEVDNPALPWSAPTFLLSLTALLTALALGIWQLRRRPLLFLAVASLLGLSFVTSNIPVPIETIFGERLLFGASIGLSFLAAHLARTMSPRWRRPLLLVLVLWLSWGAIWCVKRSLEWRDNITLIQADLPRQPRSLSLIRARAGTTQDQAEAIQLWERALAIDPAYIWALNDLANIYLQRRDLPRCAELLDSALASLHARPASRRSAGDRVHLNRGRLRLVQQQPAAAATEFREALQINPYNHYARSHLCWLHQAADRGDLARQVALAGSRLQPGRIEFDLHLALADVRAGQYQRALPFLFETLIQRGLGRTREALPGLRILQSALQRIGDKGRERAVLQLLLRLLPEDQRGPFAARLKTL